MSYCIYFLLFLGGTRSTPNKNPEAESLTNLHDAKSTESLQSPQSPSLYCVERGSHFPIDSIYYQVEMGTSLQGSTWTNSRVEDRRRYVRLLNFFNFLGAQDLLSIKDPEVESLTYLHDTKSTESLIFVCGERFPFRFRFYISGGNGNLSPRVN